MFFIVIYAELLRKTYEDKTTFVRKYMLFVAKLDEPTSHECYMQNPRVA